MGKSRIDWTERTWEPVLGCSRVSPGCENCYAERLTWRLAHNPGCGSRYHDLVTAGDERPGSPYLAPGETRHRRPRWTGAVLLDESALAAPLRWCKPSHIFVCSRSDLFHPSVPDEYIAAVFGLMAACPQHTFQVLTKRARRMRRWFEWASTIHYGHLPEEAGPVPVFQGWALERMQGTRSIGSRLPWPLPNVWLGVTAEDQQRADERIPDLLATPAAVRFVSVEPMLGPVDLEAALSVYDSNGEPSGPRCNPDGSPALGWVIVGGESGPGARPCDVAWIRDVVRQCREAGTACFVKQLGAAASDSPNGIAGAALRVGPDAAALVSHRLADRKGADPSEWPEDLRVREWPEVAS